MLQLKDNYRTILILGSVVMIAILLRLYIILITGYLWDEDREWIVAATRISLNPGNIYLPIHEFFHPSLPSYLIKLGSVILGENPLGYRFFSMIAGILSILLGFQIAFENWGARAGLWAAILLTFNEYHIAVSALATEAIYTIFFVTLAVFLFSRFLITQKSFYSYLAALSTGLACLTKYIPVLLLPVFFLTMLLSEQRTWLKRKEPYISLLIFFFVISPDLIWTLMSNPATTSQSVTLMDHLTRVGGLGFNKSPLLFYGRDAVSFIYMLIGRQLGDSGLEYPTMNLLFALILLGGVFILSILWGVWFLSKVVEDRGITSVRRYLNKPIFERITKIARSILITHNEQIDYVLFFLFIFFWTFMGFFMIIRPGIPKHNMDPAGWWWVDLSLIGAALITARLFSLAKGKWLVIVASIVSISILISFARVGRSHLGISFVNLVMEPQTVWPANEQLVTIDAHTQVCMLCRYPPSLKLTSLDQFSDTAQGLISTQDLSGLFWDEKNRVLHLLAKLTPDESRRLNRLEFTASDPIAGKMTFQSIIEVANEPPSFNFQEPFWLYYR